MPLKPYRTRKELLVPIQDIYLNKPQRIWSFNVDLKHNTNPDEWIQLRVTCPKCHWQGVERIVGNGHGQHVVTIGHQKLIKEMYFARCPFCWNAWTIDATRPYDPKTLAMNAGDDLNQGIQEVDDEIKESKEDK